MKKLIFAALASAFFLRPAAGADLLQVYRDARAYDAQFGAARYALTAAQERLPQAKALLLPALNFTGSATRSRTHFNSDNEVAFPSFTRHPRDVTYTLSLSQPIYRKQNFIQYDEAGYQVRQAQEQFAQASQDLVVRVAQAYFDVLAAQDSLELVRAQKKATAEQLAAAKRNFEVGTATITDTHEAQARYDLIVAQQIAAQNDLENKRRALQQITGKEYPSLTPLAPDVQLTPPNPDSMEAWVDLAERQSYSVQVQQATADIAQLEIKRARAGHYPTLDLVATHGTDSQSVTTFAPVGGDTTTSTIGLQVAVPIYQGGAISSRVREAVANYERSQQDLENAKRSAALAARQAYLAVLNGTAQVKALEQALVSSQSALESNKLGYEVGVRINIDVLNAQQQLYSTRRDLAVARYNTITNNLRLKAAAGTLGEDDVEEVNRVLHTP